MEGYIVRGVSDVLTMVGSLTTKFRLSERYIGRKLGTGSYSTEVDNPSSKVITYNRGKYILAPDSSLS